VRKTIALVDDDRNILTSVSMLLEAEGFQIKTYNDGASALEGLNQSPPDLGIFDIKMPRMDGMELLNRIRKTQQFPVIFLTSKDEEIDEVLGLRMGADDFIRKPFSQRLLLERIRAVLRRADVGGAKGEAAAERIVRGELVLDPSRHQCTWKGKEVHLTVTEFLLLKSPAERPGHVKKRAQPMGPGPPGHSASIGKLQGASRSRSRRKGRTASFPLSCATAPAGTRRLPGFCGCRWGRSGSRPLSSASMREGMSMTYPR